MNSSVKKSRFSKRLGKHRDFTDVNSRKKFQGVNVQLDGYNRRIVVQKTREKGNYNYSFSHDTLVSLNFGVSMGIPVEVRLEDGRVFDWKSQIYPRLQKHTKDGIRYWVVSL